MWPFRKRQDREALTLEQVLGQGPNTFSGVSVSTDSALQLSAVWSCVRLISDAISTMPCHAYRRSSQAELTQPPALLQQPAAYTDFGCWVQQLLLSALLTGNAYGLITARAGAALRPIQVEWVHPDRVSVSLTPQVIYRLDGQEIDRDDLVHFRAYVMPGSPVGLSPVAYAREAIGLGLAAQKYGAQYFGEGATPSGYLTTDQRVTQEQVNELNKWWQLRHGGHRRTAVLGQGLTFKPIMVPDDESQFLASQKFSVQQIARIFGVPVELINGDSGNAMTYSNIESRDLTLLKYGVAPWLSRIETMLDQLMPIGVYCKFNAGALLRTDLKSRYESYKLGIESGFLTVDEARELEDREPLPVSARPQLGVVA